MQKIKALNKNEIEKHYQAFSPLEITPKIHIFPELDSTNSYAKQFLKENPLESHGSIIIAEKQNAGRGPWDAVLHQTQMKDSIFPLF